MADQDKEPKRRPVLAAIVRIVATGIFVLSLFLNVVFVIIIALMGAAGDERQLVTGYRKVYSEYNESLPRGKDEEQIAVVRLTGVITEDFNGDSLLGGVEDPVDAVSNRLALIRNDDQIKGVLLLVDSPGGGVTASDALARKVRAFRQETGKPVVTLISNIGASGGYYVATASNAILARPTSLTGSIGVIVATFNVHQLLERFNIDYVPIKSADHKDALSPFKPVDQFEMEWMQGIVDQMLDRFIETVVQGRENLTRRQVQELANGLVYIAEDALDKGLIDQVGYFEDALAVLAEEAGISEPVIVEYLYQRSVFSLLNTMAKVREMSVKLRLSQGLGLPETSGARIPAGPQLWYLWEPAVENY
jgi:protease-4